ncbi:MarR family winged helix-turn-helix transcriptional regulator [Streptomyces sp. NRRL B-3648]|uniref:MarR family winged helix-turn-helix transcriptional regulator n=1 Tax=Streptomyces sp. NRRL B-3648 TaxID=1519493 RepID=UPI0006AFD520|nr:MarR family winged helix-turn-helix transcriptional regulator [Streptomyces sp. NRRL B-3648]KOV89509.1 hypothetical protein ADL04_38330 [Streptomyces sp. NRRL B-3648]
MLPIGHWLNRTDKALTRSVNGMLEELGLTRVTWQVLDVIHDTPGTADTEVLSILAATADAATSAEAVDTALADGWASRPAPGLLTLTPGGRRRLTDVAARVDAFRELSMAGISLEEYRTAVHVLERMNGNLDPAAGAGH